MMLLALDISTTQTGYACGALGRRPRYGVFRPKGSLCREERIHFIAASVRQAVTATRADKVVAEAISVGPARRKDGSKGDGNLLSVAAMAECHGAIKNELWKLGQMRMASLNLSSARAQLGIRTDLGIKGAPDKKQVREWLKRQGYPTVNDDEADALVIWLAVVMGKTGTTISNPGLKVRA